MGQTKDIQGSQVTGPSRPNVNCSPLKRACRALFFCLPNPYQYGVNLVIGVAAPPPANRLRPRVLG